MGILHEGFPDAIEENCMHWQEWQIRYCHNTDQYPEQCNQQSCIHPDAFVLLPAGNVQLPGQVHRNGVNFLPVGLQESN